MGCKSPVRKAMVCICMINAAKSTSRRQGRFQEEWSKGSPMAHVRADGQKPRRLQSGYPALKSPGESARHNKTQSLGRQGECGGCARKVHVLIPLKEVLKRVRGDPSDMRQPEKPLAESFPADTMFLRIPRPIDPPCCSLSLTFIDTPQTYYLN